MDDRHADNDNDREKDIKQANEDAGDADPSVSPGAMLAGNLTAGNTASSMMSGLVGGGPGAVAAANEGVGDEQQSSQLNLDALDALDGYGNTDRKAGDRGVSQAQSELEAGEMNG